MALACAFDCSSDFCAIEIALFCSAICVARCCSNGRDLHFPLRFDLALPHCLLLRDLRLADLALGDDLRLFGLARLRGLHLGNRGALLGFAARNFLHLRQLGEAPLAIDFQLQLLGFEILARDRDRRVLLDLVALPATVLRLLGQARQALGVERVVGIEELHGRLVDARQRHALQLETVLEQILAHGVLHALDEVLALVEQLLHRHRDGCRAQRIDELVFHELRELLRIHGAHAERLRGVGDAFLGRHDAHEECDDDIDAHAVLGEQRVFAEARHLQLQRVHVDENRLVEDGEHERAAVHDDLLAAETSAHEGTLLRRAAIQAREDEPDHQQRKEGDADQYQVVHHQGSAHPLVSFSPANLRFRPGPARD